MEIPSHYIALIQREYPKLTIERLAIDHDGMNNDVVIVNDQLACRFPKTDSARQGLQHEIAVLKLLDGEVGTAIPHLECIAENFVSYKLIQGEPLSRNLLLGMEERIRSRVLMQLGEFIEAIQGVSLAKAISAGVSDSAAQRTRETLLRMYDRIETILFPRLWKHQRTWIKEHFAPIHQDRLKLNTTQGLIHGDLACYHILYDPDRQQLQGIIDFGTAGIGSQAVDIAGLLDTYGEPLTKLAIRKLNLSERVIDEARFRAGLLWLEWALNGLENPADDLLVAHIGHSARDILPVGSAW